MIYVHQFLPLLLSPLWLALSLLLLARVSSKQIWGWLAALILIIPSMPWCANLLAVWVEGPYRWQAAETAPRVDAVVVLSGFMQAKHKEGKLKWDLQDGDRLLAGVALMKADRAPKLVFTGGRYPWSPEGALEGEAAKSLALELGISEQLIEVSSQAVNTEEEATAVRQLLNGQSPQILLVTSAFHMPRAKKLFERQGFVVTEWPVDYMQSGNALTWLQFLPHAESLSLSSALWRELLGRAYYAVKTKLI